MKHLKTKLMASVAMLMVATVMISSASFAWFTISTQPEVSGVTAGLATNQALEIALASDADFTKEPEASTGNDTGKNITWGNLVDVSAYFNNSENAATLRPAFFAEDETDGEVKLSAPTFGPDGRTSGAAALTAAGEAVGEGDTAYQDGYITVYRDANDASYAYQIDYFMRTNVDGVDIMLLAPSTTEGAMDRGAGVDGAGTTISDKSPCTVLFQVNGGEWKTLYNGGENTKDTKAEFKFDTKIIEGAKANEVYKVSMLVYWDGANATNENLNIDAADCAVNAQFTTSTPLVGLYDDTENSSNSGSSTN